MAIIMKLRSGKNYIPSIKGVLTVPVSEKSIETYEDDAVPIVEEKQCNIISGSDNKIQTIKKYLDLTDQVRGKFNKMVVCCEIMSYISDNFEFFSRITKFIGVVNDKITELNKDLSKIDPGDDHEICIHQNLVNILFKLECQIKNIH